MIFMSPIEYYCTLGIESYWVLLHTRSWVQLP